MLLIVWAIYSMLLHAIVTLWPGVEPLEHESDSLTITSPHKSNSSATPEQQVGASRTCLMLLLAFQASLMMQCIEAKMLTLNFDVFLNFVGASRASRNILAVLRRFCFELSTRFQLPVIDVIEDYTYVVIDFCVLLLAIQLWQLSDVSVGEPYKVFWSAAKWFIGMEKMKKWNHEGI